MTVRIAVVAHKGGAGKTATAANLGAAMAFLGQRVLLVDADPQGALSASFGVGAVKPTIYEVLTGQALVATAIRTTETDGVALIPADLDLAGAEIELPRHVEWYLMLRNALASLSAYDVILIDTAPGLGVLPYLALLASSSAIAVCPPEFFAYRALGQVVDTIDRAQQIVPGLRLLGIVPTLVSRRSRHEREVLEALRANYAGLLLPEIPRRVVVQDAALAGQSMMVYEPRGDVAAAFIKLAEEVLRRAVQTP
jgi:chromosome partitioning protein